MVCILLGTPPCLFMALLMLTGLAVLMIENPQVVILCTLVPLLFPGNLGNNALARSSTEAEYKALADGTAEILWIRSLLSELRLPSSPSTTLWCDNLGATFLYANPVFHARTKHVEVDYHFVRDRVAKKEIQVRFISSKDQLADVLTKPLPLVSFVFFRSKLQVESPPSA